MSCTGTGPSAVTACRRRRARPAWLTGWAALAVLWAAACTHVIPPQPAAGDAQAEVADDAAADVVGTEGLAEEVAAGCKNAADCPAGELCHVPSGACVQCLVGTDCPGELDLCRKGACVARIACQSDKVCSATGQVCDLAAGVCVDCAGAADCTGGQTCAGGLCVPPPLPCQSSKDCAAADQVCDKARQICVECVDDEDCGTLAHCAFDRCTTDACHAGEQQCQGPDAVRTCVANGSAFATTPCPGGQACIDDACAAVVCQAGAKVCQPGGVATCNAGGTGYGAPVACGAAQICADGACVAQQCQPGVAQCGDAAILTCQADGLGWSSQPCGKDANGKALLCVEAAVGPSCVAQVCTPGSQTCQGNQVQQCDAKGTTLQVIATCKGGEVCLGGQCQSQQCKPGAKSCLDAATAATCSPDGLAWQPQACAAGQTCTDGGCAQVICVPGATFCAGTQRKTCNASGTAATVVEDCASSGKLCQQGACVTPLCAPATTQCQGGQLAVCAADGSAWQAQDCPAGSVCSVGSCKPLVCKPYALACSGQVVAKCNSAGTASTVVSDCAASGQFCWQGACVAQVCDAGSKACLDGAVGTCKADGSGYTEQPCTDGNACTDDTCNPASLSCSYPPKDCGDGNPCTSDGCAAGSGACIHPAVAGPCDDGSACTAKEACANGKCVASGPGSVAAVAGKGTPGFVDAIGANAAFGQPADVAWAPDGSVYVADAANHAIRRILPDGTVSTVAGNGQPGGTDGAGATAQLAQPAGIAVDKAGVVYVAEVMGHRIRRIGVDGQVTTIAGNGTPTSYDGQGKGAGFNAPAGLCLDAKGQLYVADSGNHRIRKVTPAGVVSTVAGSVPGYLDGAALGARFAAPVGIAIDSQGVLYVADTGNHRIRRIGPDGQVSTVAGSSAGAFDGVGAAAKFDGPRDVVWSATGQLFVADAGNHRVRSVAADGTTATAAGTGTPGGLDGVATAATFHQPGGLGLSHAGVLLVADTLNHRIRKLVPDTVTCHDADPCTLDSCDAKTGLCSFQPVPGCGG